MLLLVSHICKWLTCKIILHYIRIALIMTCKMNMSKYSESVSMIIHCKNLNLAYDLLCTTVTLLSVKAIQGHVYEC